MTTRALPSLCLLTAALGCGHRPTAACARDDVDGFVAFAIAPGGHRYAELDEVAGGGAAGYTGVAISVVTVGAPRRDVALLHDGVARSHLTLTWPHPDELVIAGCLDAWDTEALTAGVRGAFDGATVRYEPRCTREAPPGDQPRAIQPPASTRSPS
jgi:hypothetical protein